MHKATMLVALFLVLISSAVITSLMVKSRLDRRHDFSPLLDAIEAHEITEGSNADMVLKRSYGKPTTDVVRYDNHGKKWGLLGYHYRSSTLLLYWREGQLFAACLIRGVSESKEIWYFCDRKLFSYYLDLSTNIPHAQTGADSVSEELPDGSD